ncbi:hypothetical protein [Noviherbaspirillum aridicola]|uniref:Uncharacterized protein n=1 Tax=Noviherbaspirillum aridicola TaxID=2849687 RepID=A0ABQ4Q6V0_9BURK|nr:hypothetical protein [Noviherbaspirillum aridicola]GIZ52779.1 hypothetical protein NCCP691_27930 [Noviherbaspirillum aridicola]
MNPTSKKVAAAAVVLTSLAGCGGGGDGDAVADQGGSRLAPTVWTVDGRATNSCSYEPRCTNNPYAPFNAYGEGYTTTSAPPNGAVLSGIVRLQVQGLEMGNVELLPATGYTPRLGVFGLSRDKTQAWLDFDTTRLPNGPLAARVSAFNVGAGQPGAVELVPVPARTWTISNPPLPGTGLTATLTSAPASGATVSGTVRLEVRGTRIANAELLPAQGYTPRLGVFNVSADRTVAWLDLDTRSVPDGTRDVRISVYSVTEGQPDAQEIVVMPARRWTFSNGASAAFTAGVSAAPAHGATVRGTVVVEVRGAGMRNIELLPASGYQPVYGRFTTAYDGSFGYVEFDTRTLPNGPLTVRVSAFNVAPGQAGAREIVAMPARQWIVAN